MFRGGYTLQRVTAPVGEDRHSLLLSYVAEPANIVSAEKAARIWGEAHPLHSKRAARNEIALLFGRLGSIDATKRRLLPAA